MTGMKTNGISRLVWLVTGLVLGGTGGFLAGRHGPVTAIFAGWDAPPGPVQSGPAASGKEKAAGAAQGAVSTGQGGAAKQGIPLGESPRQTLRNILANPDPIGRMAVLKEWCRTLPPDQVVEVLKEFQGMVEAQERIGEMEAASLLFQSVDVMAQAMLDQGAEEVLAVFLAPVAKGENAELRLGLGGEIFKKWAERDPSAARALLELRLVDPDKIDSTEKELSKHLMRAWIKNEPEAAMAWLLKQPKAIEDDAVSPAFQALSHHNPDKALEMVAAQADRPGRDEIAAVIAQWWAKTTPDKAMEWAQGLPEKLAGPSVKRAMESWAEKDFPAAKQALEELRAPMREAALPVLVDHWPKQNWGEAAAFLDQQPAGEGRKAAVGQLVRQWAGGDQQAASAWLARQPAGPERDTGAVALAGEVRDSDPEAAAIWGATLQEPQLREESLRDTLAAWYRKSVPEALHWLETAPGLTENERTALLAKKPGE